jgi:hypothetical protein
MLESAIQQALGHIVGEWLGQWELYRPLGAGKGRQLWRQLQQHQLPWIHADMVRVTSIVDDVAFAVFEPGNALIDALRRLGQNHPKALTKPLQQPLRGPRMQGDVLVNCRHIR